MPQATCYMCTHNTASTVTNPVGKADQPFGACCRCCSFACGHHGVRVQGKFRCVLCFASTICAIAAQASGVGNETARRMLGNEPSDETEGADDDDVVNLYGIRYGEGWQKFDAEEFGRQLGEDFLGRDLREIHRSLLNRNRKDLLQFAAFTSLAVEPEASGRSLPNYLERLRDGYRKG
jgi:hypothetical protein